MNPGSSVAYNLMNAPAVAGEPGKWLVPNPTGVTTAAHPYNVAIPGTAYFFADQVVADLDWNASAKDTLALKYYYQHDPTDRALRVFERSRLGTAHGRGQPGLLRQQRESAADRISA